MTAPRSPSCERCIWYCEAAFPRDYIFCQHPEHRGEVTELDKPRCGGAGFELCDPYEEPKS